MVLTVRQAQELFDIAKEQGLILMEAIKTACCPGFRRLVSCAKSGKIVSIDATFTKLVPSRSRELQNDGVGGSVNEFATYPLLAILKLLDMKCRDIQFTSYKNSGDGVDLFTRIDLTYVSTNREAFDCYLDTEEFRKKVKRFKADSRTCVEAIKSAGGKVSLAHPYQMGLPDDELEALVARPKEWGLDAIECYYPKYTPEQQAFYLHLAEKYRPHRTGGSDFHGEKVKPDVELAKWPLELDWLIDSPKLCRQRFVN